MEPSNLESQPNIKETFPEYFPILEVDNKSRLILKHYKPRLRSFSAPATSHVQQDDREDDRKDDQEDFIILHDPKLTPETLQRSISLTRNGDQVGLSSNNHNVNFLVMFNFPIYVDFDSFIR
jgi:hypothetical protein